MRERPQHWKCPKQVRKLGHPTEEPNIKVPYMIPCRGAVRNGTIELLRNKEIVPAAGEMARGAGCFIRYGSRSTTFNSGRIAEMKIGSRIAAIGKAD
jgi:hypothetical protein